jgi:hypothetical protein
MTMTNTIKNIIQFSQKIFLSFVILLSIVCFLFPSVPALSQGTNTTTTKQQTTTQQNTNKTNPNDKPVADGTILNNNQNIIASIGIKECSLSDSAGNIKEEYRTEDNSIIDRQQIACFREIVKITLVFAIMLFAGRIAMQALLDTNPLASGKVRETATEVIGSGTAGLLLIGAPGIFLSFINPTTLTLQGIFNLSDFATSVNQPQKNAQNTKNTTTNNNVTNTNPNTPTDGDTQDTTNATGFKLGKYPLKDIVAILNDPDKNPDKVTEIIQELIKTYPNRRSTEDRQTYNDIVNTIKSTAKLKNKVIAQLNNDAEGDHDINAELSALSFGPNNNPFFNYKAKKLDSSDLPQAKTYYELKCADEQDEFAQKMDITCNKNQSMIVIYDNVACAENIRIMDNYINNNAPYFLLTNALQVKGSCKSRYTDR